MRDKELNVAIGIMFIALFIAIIALADMVNHNPDTYKQEYMQDNNYIIYKEPDAPTEMEQIVIDHHKETYTITSECILQEYTSAEDAYIAQCVFAEAGNQDEMGKRLVIDVILNRVDSTKFPNTATDVINQTGQFEVVYNGSINAPVYDDILELIKQEKKNRTNYDVLYFCTGGYQATPVIKWQDHYFSK